MGIITEENNKNTMIQDLITEISNKTQGITVEQIINARKRYKNDPRSIEEIKKELERLSKEITEASIRRKEAEQQFTVKQMNSKVSVVDIKEDVNEVPIMITNSDNLQQSVNESMELDSMFTQTNNKHNIQLPDTKGKTLIKVMDSKGFANTMNLMFILTTMSIVGLFIASIVILISK